MDLKLLIVLLLVFLFFLLMSFWGNLNKKLKKEKLIKNWGQLPKRKYDERDFTSIRQLFDQYAKDDSSFLDEETWNDLQLSKLYQKMNNSMSSIGDEYLFRQLRMQHYPNLDRLEKHVQYFATHENDRTSLQLAFSQINRTSSRKNSAGISENQTFNSRENNYICYVENPSLFKSISFKPYIIIALISISFFISLFLFKISKDMFTLYTCFAGLIVFFLSLLYFFGFLRKVGNSIYNLTMFINSAKAANKIILSEPDIFSSELTILKKALKKTNTKLPLISFLLDSTMMLNPAYVYLSFITMLFGVYTFVYKLASDFFKESQNEIENIYETIGYFELCINLSSYRATLPFYCTPEFSDKKELIFDNIYHPLLKNPIDNSKSLGQRLIITGANASGKSTFAKTLAINAITAQTLNTCFANKFVMRPASVITSMNLEDNILIGDSFYMAEIKRLKKMKNLSDNPQTYEMFFMDELLKGTNTTDRIASASAILRNMADKNCFICLTTHDIELTSILSKHYDNYYFKEHATQTAITYDYKLYDGVTTGSNAIALLSVCQFEPTIVEQAEKSARHFRETALWEQL